MPLPKVIASSVIRSAHQGDSHGGVYLLDLESGMFEQVIDWNTVNIDWEGRGADRGLRGIAFHNGEVYICASDEIFVFDRLFKIVRSHKNPYLRHCHETFLYKDTLYLTSTGFDSVLAFDIPSARFTRGFCFRATPGPGGQPHVTAGVFDPGSGKGPTPGDTVHVNNVHVDGGMVFFSALRVPVLFTIRGGRAAPYATIPSGTHNARPYRWKDADHVLANCTELNAVCLLDRQGKVVRQFKIKMYAQGELLNTHLPADHARQGFGRGLCVLGDGLIAAGSSPSTISVYDLDAPADSPGVVKIVNLSLDIRNAVHGLEVWPFDRG